MLGWNYRDFWRPGNLLGTGATFARCLREQALDGPALRRLQARKLGAVLRSAHATVPFYRALLDAAGIAPATIRGLDDLARVPLTTRPMLQAATLDERRSALFSSDGLNWTATSGSSGRPLDTGHEPAFERLRRAVHLRHLIDNGYRPGQRVLHVNRQPAQPPRWSGWFYFGFYDPETFRQRLAEVRPEVLVIGLPQMRTLLDHLATGGGTVPRVERIHVSSEVLDDPTRARIGEVFGSRVVNFYGTVEMGLLGWEQTGREGMRLAEENVIFEFLPTPEAGVYRVVLTSLELTAMPFIRYDTGDLATLVPGTEGRGMRRRIARLEGRTLDMIRLADGRHITPMRFAAAVRRVEGVERFQVVQETPDRFTVRVQTPREDLDTLAAEVRGRLEDRIGAGFGLIRVERVASLEEPPGRKFRLVLSRVSAAAEGAGVPG